jgi:FkbM family methyltransferase
MEGLNKTMVHLSPAPFWVRASCPVIRRLPAGRYRAMNGLVNLMRRFGCGRQPFLAETSTPSESFHFICHLSDALAREVCYTGRYEPLETLLIRKILKPGMVFVDVGANWGYFTLLGAACIGPLGRVLSVEPHPHLFALLRANLDYNGYHNVTPLSLAVGAQTGTALLTGFDEHGGNWGLSRIVSGGDSSNVSFPVATAQLDHIVKQHEIDVVDLLKIDIEGSEDEALQGMGCGLADRRYLRLLLELHPTILWHRGKALADIVDPLVRHGYRGWWIDHSPAMTKKAYYTTAPNLGEFLRPINDPNAANSWPHTLWIAPGSGLQPVP